MITWVCRSLWEEVTDGENWNTVAFHLIIKDYRCENWFSLYKAEILCMSVFWFVFQIGFLLWKVDIPIAVPSMTPSVYIHSQQQLCHVHIGPGDSVRATLSTVTVKNALLDINAKIWKLSVVPSGQPICT